MKYVYLLRAGQVHYKVGVAVNVTRRVKELQTSNPTTIEVVSTRLVDDAYKLENAMHIMLATAKSGPSREWFELTPGQAIDVLIAINQAAEIDMTKQITIKEILAAADRRQTSIEALLNLVVSEYRKTLPPPFVMKPKPDTSAQEAAEQAKAKAQQADEDLFQRAVRLVTAHGSASTSMLQRRLRLGYGRAARLMDRLEADNIIEGADGNRPRNVIHIVGPTGYSR